MTEQPTPKSVADALRDLMDPGVLIFDVELLQTGTRGCVARALIGLTKDREFEVSGVGQTLESAIVELYNEVRSRDL